MYLEIKTFHLTTVAASVLLYLFRFMRYHASSEVQQQPVWLKHLPHINDTLLFCSGIALISITKFIPFTQAAPWLTVKLVAIFFYILCGFWAMKKTAERRTRIFFFLASLGWLFVILTLAIKKHWFTLL